MCLFANVRHQPTGTSMNSNLINETPSPSSPEALYPLAIAVERATGQRPHPSTLHRWRLRGIAGVRLETVRVGGRRLCSVEAVRRFVDRVTLARDVASSKAAPPKSCNSAIERNPVIQIMIVHNFRSGNPGKFDLVKLLGKLLGFILSWISGWRFRP